MINSFKMLADTCSPFFNPYDVLFFNYSYFTAKRPDFFLVTDSAIDFANLSLFLTFLKSSLLKINKYFNNDNLANQQAMENELSSLVGDQNLFFEELCNVVDLVEDRKSLPKTLSKVYSTVDSRFSGPNTNGSYIDLALFVTRLVNFESCQASTISINELEGNSGKIDVNVEALKEATFEAFAPILKFPCTKKKNVFFQKSASEESFKEDCFYWSLRKKSASKNYAEGTAKVQFIEKKLAVVRKKEYSSIEFDNSYEDFFNKLLVVGLMFETFSTVEKSKEILSESEEEEVLIGRKRLQSVDSDEVFFPKTVKSEEKESDLESIKENLQAYLDSLKIGRFN